MGIGLYDGNADLLRFIRFTGELGSYIQLMVTIGILYVYVIGALFDYMMLNILCAVIPIVFLIFFMVVAPETPTYLLRKNRRLVFYRWINQSLLKSIEEDILVFKGY